MTAWERLQAARLVAYVVAWSALGGALVFMFESAASARTVLPELMAAGGLVGACQWADRVQRSRELLAHRALGGGVHRVAASVALGSVVLTGVMATVAQLGPRENAEVPAPRAATFEGGAVAFERAGADGRTLDGVVWLEPAPSGGWRGFAAERWIARGGAWIARGARPLGSRSGPGTDRVLARGPNPRDLAAALEETSIGPDATLRARERLGWSTGPARWARVRVQSMPAVVALLICAAAGWVLSLGRKASGLEALGWGLGFGLTAAAADLMVSAWARADPDRAAPAAGLALAVLALATVGAWRRAASRA